MQESPNPSVSLVSLADDGTLCVLDNISSSARFVKVYPGSANAKFSHRDKLAKEGTELKVLHTGRHQVAIILQQWEKEPIKFLHVTDLDTMQRLWNLPMSGYILGNVFPIKCKHNPHLFALQVKIILGQVWIGTESGVAVVSPMTGKVLKTILFEKKMALNHSSKIQSKINLWHFDLVDAGRKLLVMHDIERSAPTALDVYDLS